jgi:hypothetical protein
MRKIVGIGLLALLASCASNPYRGSEKIYSKQIRSFSKDLKKKEMRHQRQPSFYHDMLKEKKYLKKIWISLEIK